MNVQSRIYSIMSAMHPKNKLRPTNMDGIRNDIARVHPYIHKSSSLSFLSLILRSPRSSKCRAVFRCSRWILLKSYIR